MNCYVHFDLIFKFKSQSIQSSTMIIIALGCSLFTQFLCLLYLFFYSYSYYYLLDFSLFCCLTFRLSFLWASVKINGCTAYICYTIHEQKLNTHTTIITFVVFQLWYIYLFIFGFINLFGSPNKKKSAIIDQKNQQTKNTVWMIKF